MRGGTSRHEHVHVKRCVMFFAAALSVCTLGSTADPSTPPPSASASSSATMSPTPFSTSTVKPTPPSSPAPTLVSPAAPFATAVHFVDREHGWLGLSDGILASIDGGRTWSRQLSGVPVGGLSAYDARHAWAPSGSDLYRTVDGVHWNHVSSAASEISEVQFVTPLVGWLVATQPTPVPFTGRVQLAGSLLGSTDGGLTWQPVSTRSIWSVCFTDERNGWGADGKVVFKTTDAGRTWTTLIDLTIADEGPWHPTIRCADATNARVQVTEPFAALSHRPYLMYRTSDGGKSWVLEYRELYTLGQTTPREIPQLGSYPSLFDALRDHDTWIVTCSPPAQTQEMLVLSPAGAVLGRGAIPFKSCVNDASFVDAQHGWVIGPEYHASETESVVLRTPDGGASWERIYPP